MTLRIRGCMGEKTGEIISAEKRGPDAAKQYLDNTSRDGVLKTTGAGFDKIMTPVSRFGGGNRGVKRRRIIAPVLRLFEKYAGVA